MSGKSGQYDEPLLNADMRYTPNTAAYWRSMGRTIFDEWIIYPDDVPDSYSQDYSEELIPENNMISWSWKANPFISNGKRRWQINYSFHSDDKWTSHDEEHREKIRNGLQKMEDQTCLTFVEQNKDFPDYPGGLMRFVSAYGCWTTIGRDPMPRDSPNNLISLGESCTGIGTIHHEVMHSLGVGHEQGRFDRDDHVDVHWDNIQETYLSQFNKVDEDRWVDMKVPYDFHSVMQYGGNSFQINKDEPTISYKRDGHQIKKGDPVENKGGMGSFGMSSMDVYQLCKMYECETCAHRDIPTYEGKAYENYMYQCKKSRMVSYISELI